MEVYIWRADYGQCHAVAVADSVVEARLRINAARAKAKLLYKEAEILEDNGDYQEADDAEHKASEITPDLISHVDISGEPDYVLSESINHIGSVCLNLGNDC